MCEETINEECETFTVNRQIFVTIIYHNNTQPLGRADPAPTATMIRITTIATITA